MKLCMIYAQNKFGIPYFIGFGEMVIDENYFFSED